MPCLSFGADGPVDLFGWDHRIGQVWYQKCGHVTTPGALIVAPDAHCRAFCGMPKVGYEIVEQALSKSVQGNSVLPTKLRK